MDFEYADRLWSESKVETLLFGRQVPDSEAFLGWADVPATSWYQMRCKALDHGDVRLVHDAIQLEQAVSMIDDFRVRAAVTLAMMGWELPEIGAAINDRRTGRQLVKAGVRAIAREERRRRDRQGS